MSDELFEIAFSGQVSAGADPQEVKARVGKMFSAEGAKLDQLFSGQQLVIKKNVDQQTAQKYQDALQRVGAECEVKSMSASAPAAPPKPIADPPVQSDVAQAEPSAASASDTSAGEVLPPKTDPLGITGDQIEAMAATIAPPGSELQSEIKSVPEPQYDLSAYEMAPVGDTLGSTDKGPAPALPDTSGLSMVD
jgi:hypothetical protein